MEKYISETDVLVNIKKYRDSLSYDELFDIEMEFKIINLGDKGKARFEKNDRYTTYLGKRYERHKKK
jgi:hypothetical protein